MQYYPTDPPKSTIRRALRPDVQQLVTTLVNDAPRTGDWRDWRHYYHAKKMMRHRCGWDAREGYDQSQFDMGMRTYVEGVGL